MCVSLGLVSLFYALSDLPLNDVCSFRPPRALAQSHTNQITEDYCQSALCRRGLIYIGKTRQGKRAIIENGFMRDLSWIKESASHNVALLCFVQVPGYEDCTESRDLDVPSESQYGNASHSFTFFGCWNGESSSCFLWGMNIVKHHVCPLNPEISPACHCWLSACKFLQAIGLYFGHSPQL